MNDLFKNLTLIIPAKDESESLPIVLKEIKQLNLQAKIILKENDQATINAIKNFEYEILYQPGEGYGDALIYGIENCGTEFYCIFNADGSFDPKEIKLMMANLIDNNLDIVFGSRYQSNSGSEDDTLVTLIGNYIFTYIGKIFFLLPLNDILYTFVLGKTLQTKNLGLKQKDFSFCVELPIKSKKNNLKIKSFPCYERTRIAGTKKVNAFKDGFLILKHMIKLFFFK
tara:strand:- start:6549 stop:7229 length:681 start_codon:yes stop_codon:yes gene_type:complete